MNSFLRKITLAALLLSGLSVSAQFTGKPQYNITTYRAGVLIGTIKIELFPLIAPLQARNFDSLVSTHFFDTTAFHRVVPGFVIQGGDPNSRHGARSTWGLGDTTQPKVKAEFSAVKHVRGILSAARDNDINSANSQFFICVATASNLDGQYSAYGHVVTGMNYVDNIVASPRDANDNPLQKIEMFVNYTGSNDTVPDAPSLVLPIDNTVNLSQNAVIKWNKVRDAVLYHLEFSTDAAFSTINLTIKTADTTFLSNGLNGLTKYYWRVKANNGGHLSNSSVVRNFTTATGAANLIAPADSATTQPLTVTFSWDAVNGANGYHLQVNNLANTFPASRNVYNAKHITATSVQVSGLALNTHYYWRVQSEKDSVDGFYSVTRYFRTETAVGINPIADNGFNLLQNVPNPAKEQTQIQYTIDSESLVTLKIYDISGTEISTVINQKQQAGTYIHLLNTSKLASGIYFYKLEAGAEVSVRKMLINN
jgi:peptidyl-prolyl cis-trans isomerase B (cyclophilin B)